MGSRGLSGLAFRRLVAAAVATTPFVVLGGSAPAEASEAVYRFVIPPVEADPGASVRVTVQGEHAEPAEGFSIALRFPAATLRIDRVHMDDTILEAIGVDYFEKKLSPEEGTLVLGVLVDVDPPFDGTLIPTIGRPLDFIHIELTVSPDADGDQVLAFEDGLSVPPIANEYAVGGQPVPVTELGEGRIRVGGEAGSAASFFRGDVNLDASLDISDPIAILGFVFLGEFQPPCLASADANDDESVDVSDPVFLLQYLFQNGAPPPPPHAEPGVDATPGPLACVRSLWLQRGR